MADCCGCESIKHHELAVTLTFEEWAAVLMMAEQGLQRAVKKAKTVHMQHQMGLVAELLLKVTTQLEGAHDQLHVESHTS